MGKFDGILICTDLDGTLYKNDLTISEKNKEAIELFKREGGSFTFITGRLPYYATEAFNAVQPNIPFGCINGGGVFDGWNNKYIWTQELSLRSIELVRYIDKSFSDIGIQLCGFDETFFARDNDLTARFRAATGIPHLTADYNGFSTPIAKIIFCSDEEDKLAAIEKALREHPLAGEFDFIRSEKVFFEVLPKGINKGIALKKLAEYLNIDISKTVAIGDYDNDVAMLRAAGCGIAVSNASRAALLAADIVTVSNEEDAIAKVIGDLEKGLLPI